MDATDFIKRVCKQLVRDLTANDDVLGLTSNSDLKGAFAEASVHQFLRRFVAPLRVSRGAIVYEGNCGDKVPELDGIIWQPCPLPPILEAGDFAFVPRSSALAFLEIKRSNYTGAGKAMRDHLALEDELVPLVEGIGAWNAVPRRAFGVVCVHDTWKRDEDLAALMAADRAAALLQRRTADASFEPNPDGILLLASFLMGVRRRAIVVDGRVVAQVPSQPNVAGQAGAPVQTPPFLPIAPTSGFVGY